MNDERREVHLWWWTINASEDIISSLPISNRLYAYSKANIYSLAC
jgi:hypothetical protein